MTLATRLVAAAEPGQMLADASVHDQLPDQEVIEAKPFTLKGFDEPVATYACTVPSDG